MESLFKLTELESRIPLNMNVLVKGRVPKVDRPCRSLARMARPPPRRAGAALEPSASKQIEHRLEVLGGYLIAYLNLDKVIKIIRNEDEPKPVLMKTFKLTDVQAEAILNMRLRNLRKLEEMEIRKEDKELRAEKKTLEELLGSEKRAVEDDRRRRSRRCARRSARRRRSASAAPTSPRRPSTTRPRSRRRMVEREPITVVVSEKGWIRALRGHVDRSVRRRVQGGRRAEDSRSSPRPRRNCLVFGTNGRFYTLEAAKLPGGRGHGEPVRLFIDLEQEADIVTVFPFQGGRKFLVASHQGRGFVVPEDECLGQHPQGQAGAQREGAGRGARDRAGRGRAGRQPSARTARW